MDNIPFIKGSIVKKILTIITALLVCAISFASESLYQQARTLQREGKHDEAIEAFKRYLVQPVDAADITDHELALHTEALMHKQLAVSRLCVVRHIDEAPHLCLHNFTNLVLTHNQKPLFFNL